MLIFTGIVGILQMTILPGVILHRLISPPDGFFRCLLHIFSLSLVANYLLVFMLTSLGLYTRLAMFSLITLEIIFIIYLFRKFLTTNLDVIAVVIHKQCTQLYKNLQPDAGRWTGVRLMVLLIRCLFGLAAVIALGWIIRVTFTNAGTVFNSWDAVVSWNRWAVDWAGNHIPTNTWNYPQLVPINWSIPYVLMGDLSLQLIPKAIIPLFSLGILLTFLDLALQKRSTAYLLGLALAAYLLRTMLGEYIGEGYSDIPAAFFGFLAITSLLRQERESASFQLSYIIGCVLVGAAAVTKQTGVLFCALFAIFSFLAYFLPINTLSFRQKLQQWALPLLIVGLFAGSWYIYKQIEILRGLDESEVALIGDIANRAYDQTNLFLQSLKAFASLGKTIFFFVLTIPAMLVLDRKYKLLVGLVILPFTLIWSIYASYDPRNLAMMYPLVALVLGVAIDHSLDLLTPWLEKLKLDRLPTAVILVLVIIGVGTAAARISDSDLVNRQVNLQKQIFNPHLNEKIYDLLDETGQNALILTDYPVRYLPSLEANQFKLRFNDLEKLQLALTDSNIEFILLPKSATREIEAYIASAVERGEMELLFTETRWKPYAMYRVIDPGN